MTWLKDIIYVGTKEIAEVSPTGTSITMTDHLGSPRFTWDGVTTPIQQKFLPFGESLTLPGDAAKFAKGFTNHEQTDASGLIYAQARFYLPMWGRFASPDPARDQHFEETQSWNIYSYVKNNPVMSFDPDGMQECRAVNQCIDYHDRQLMNARTPQERAAATQARMSDYKGLAVGGATGAMVASGPGLVNAAASAGRTAIGWLSTTGAAFVQSAKDLLNRSAQAAPAAQAVTQTVDRSLGISNGQVEAKFKHAADFGVTASRGAEGFAQFKDAIVAHVGSEGTQAIQGTYRGANVTHYLNQTTGLNVIKNVAGQFVSGWKLSVEQLKNVTTSGNLGGGR